MKFNLKNKYFLYTTGIILFLLFYYIYFVHGKVDLSFSAKDLTIHTINNQNDFEKIIVKNLYDKIVDSCDNNQGKFKNYQDTQGSFIQNDFGILRDEEIRITQEMRNTGLNFSSSDNLSSIRGTTQNADVSKSIIPSIDFNGNTTKQETAKDVNFSQTNIQKQAVDEGDILKQTKDYIFYFSKSKSKIYIIQSPMNGEKIDINSVKIFFTINIPSNLNTNPELFVNDTKLVYIASKTSYNNNNTIVGIYDLSNLSNGNVSLYKVFETKGTYFKSRLIGNKLYLISDYSMQPFKSKYCNMLKNNDGGFGEFITFFTGIKFRGFGLNKEIYEDLKNELESYSYNLNDLNLSGNGEMNKLNKYKVFYTNKDLKETIENLNFNVVSVVDISDQILKESQNLFFGNLKNGEIHMTLDNIYLVNSFYQKEKWKCDYIDICYKNFSSNYFTSISKISYTGENLNFENAGVIPGMPINQYSMDDDEGYFRIFTTGYFNKTNASLYVFDKKFKLIGQLENIKPGEQFKSSRFIGDKAYLVTFRQIDPLFVIDLHVPSEPKIIGELHIPGYSNYLHPYGKIGNKDYLIGLGLDLSKVKVDLYEIDYNNVQLGGMVDVKQKYTYLFNDGTGKTPALDNPRAFVWDNEDKKLYLPISIVSNDYNYIPCQPDQKNYNCIYRYDNKTNTYFYSEYKSIGNNFTGLKSLKIDLDNGISEIDSYNVKDLGNVINSRVGYYKTKDDKTLFFVDDGFISLFKDKLNENTINFN